MNKILFAAALAATLTGCSRAGPVVNDAAIETAVSSAADRALILGRQGGLTPQGVTVMVGTTDRYGKKGEAAALRFTWRAEDLQRITWSGMNGYSTLDLARPEILSRFGAKALGSWCIDPRGDNGRTLTPTLCETPYQTAAAAYMNSAPDSVSASPN